MAQQTHGTRPIRDMECHPLKAVSRFTLHTIAGAAMFVVVGATAAALNYGASLIARTGVSSYIVLAIQGLEFFLFSADFICLVVLIVRETWTFVREVLAPEE